MKNNFVFLYFITLIMLLTSCTFSVQPFLKSIEFIDDKTIEYEFSFVIGDNASGRYKKKKFSITPDNEYRIKYQTFSVTKGTVYFNKNIPDGVTVKLDFEDSEGKTNLSLADVGGELLMISQFTLYANCKKGYRPSFIEAGKPDMANELYEYICEECKKSVPVVEKGVFGAHMHVSLLNDGPFTIILDSRDL